MNICILINDLGKTGGLRTVAINLANALMENGHEVLILSAVNHSEKIGNIKVDTLGLEKLHCLNKVNKVFWYLKCFYSFYKFSRERNDTFIGIGTLMNIMMYSKAPRVIATEHTAYKNNNKIIQWTRKLTYSKFKKIVLLTQRDKHYYEKINDNVVVIPNFIEGVRKVEYSETSHRVLFVGMLSKVKGSDYLIEIIKKSVLSNSDIHFDIVGDGPEFTTFSEAVKSLSINDRVSIHGRLNDVTSLYQNASLFILTSRNEGFPMVILEAQSHGLPVVSFDCETGPSEIIRNGFNGYLIDEFDVEEFSKHLVDLFESISSRSVMSVNSVQSVKKFSKKEVIRLWDEVLKQ